MISNLLILDLTFNWKNKIKFFLKLRQTVFNFVQKELAPQAKEIDQQNGFKDLKVKFQIFYY
jgi:hypothetical protein